MIYAGMMWRELRDFFVFEDISELGVFEGDKSSGGSGSCGYGFGRNIIRGEVRIEVNRSGEGFFIASDISDREEKEFIALWINLLSGKDSRETTFGSMIRVFGGFSRTGDIRVFEDFEVS